MLLEAQRGGWRFIDEHFRPQSTVCRFDAISYDVVIPLENSTQLEHGLRAMAVALGRPYVPMPHNHTANAKHPLPDRIRERIEHLYAADAVLRGPRAGIARNGWCHPCRRPSRLRVAAAAAATAADDDDTATDAAAPAACPAVASARASGRHPAISGHRVHTRATLPRVPSLSAPEVRRAPPLEGRRGLQPAAGFDRRCLPHGRHYRRRHAARLRPTMRWRRSRTPCARVRRRSAPIGNSTAHLLDRRSGHRT